MVNPSRNPFTEGTKSTARKPTVRHARKSIPVNVLYDGKVKSDE
jgi:hypothetical protein